MIRGHKIKLGNVLLCAEYRPPAGMHYSNPDIAREPIEITIQDLDGSVLSSIIRQDGHDYVQSIVALTNMVLTQRDLERAIDVV